jgi:hypothetical protein
MKSYYDIRGTIRYYALLPKTLEAVPNDEAVGNWGDIQGTLRNEPIDALRWKEPPHLVLANLATIQVPPVDDQETDYELMKSLARRTLEGSKHAQDLETFFAGNRVVPEAMMAFLRRFGPLSVERRNQALT